MGAKSLMPVVQAMQRLFAPFFACICPCPQAARVRHSYAVATIESGDDIKTVQGNLGHATASFTLDVYGHVSQKMRQQSAERMEAFIRKVSG